jgi:hypothetical protein
VEQDGESTSSLEMLWHHTLEGWSDEARHAALLEYALRTGALPEIAGRYRSLLDDPEKGPRAKERIDAIVSAATTLLFSNKTPAPGKVPWSITLSAVGACAFLLLWLAWAVFSRR